MVVPSKTGNIELSWIDFQDALLGPRVYDLVALLSDSYQEFDAAFIDERLAEYAEHMALAIEPICRRSVESSTSLPCSASSRTPGASSSSTAPTTIPLPEVSSSPPFDKARAAIERLGDDADMRDAGGLVGASPREVGPMRQAGHEGAARRARRDGLIGGEVVPLYSGSVHYWRLERADLARRAGRYREARASDSSTPMSPGACTRSRRAKLDFGESDVGAMSSAFLRLVHELGLYAIVRPGPHINAELTSSGSPSGWCGIRRARRARPATIR